jgi:signal transduction histidine kinase/ActR/RegA family two-component response regulator
MDFTVVQDRPEPFSVPGEDRTSAALAYLHGLLLAPAAERADWAALLTDLAQAFAATGAGLGLVYAGAMVVRHRVRADDATPSQSCPWDEARGILERIGAASGAEAVTGADGSSWLLTMLRPSTVPPVVLWLEGAPGRAWSAGECAALDLAGQTLAERARPEANMEAEEAQERAGVQAQMEIAAHVASHLAHDFGNLLTGILGFAELSLTQLSPHTTPYRFVTEVWQAAHKGAQWIRKLQLFSRRGATPPGPSTLAALLVEDEPRWSAACGPSVALHLAVPDDLPAVKADADSLRQLLGELLDNAREAITGPGVIALSARPVELTAADCCELVGNAAPGAHLEITVADTGGGINPAARRRLFREVFFSTKPRHRGLGLAVVYGILHACRGGLRFGPGPEQGAAVRVFLPVAASARPSAERVPPSSGERILVVDDDPLILQFVGTTLQQAGYRVQTAASGQEALSLYAAAAEPYGLVLTDVVMPQMSGIDLARRLRRFDPQVNLLFLSNQDAGAARSDPEVRSVEVLQKPFRPDALVRTVALALGRGSRPRPGAAATRTTRRT